MNKIFTILGLFFLSFSSYSNTKFPKGDTLMRFKYINVNKKFFKIYPSHIAYCEFVLYKTKKNLLSSMSLKKLNRILASIDSIGKISIFSDNLRGFNSYTQIPALTRVNDIGIFYNKFEDTGIFYLNNVKSLSLSMAGSKIIHIPRTNYNLRSFHTNDHFDFTLLNLKNLDSLYWGFNEMDSLSRFYIARHPGIYYLQLNSEKKYLSKKDIVLIVEMLDESKSIKELGVYEDRFEEGAIKILSEFCNKNNIKLIFPYKYSEKPIESW